MIRVKIRTYQVIKLILAGFVVVQENLKPLVLLHRPRKLGLHSKDLGLYIFLHNTKPVSIHIIIYFFIVAIVCLLNKVRLLNTFCCRGSRSWCLNDKPALPALTNVSFQHYGTVYSGDKQCELAYGKGYSHCWQYKVRF